ncbi:MAG: DNA-processing protein DprA [Bacteroidaceae bacterium]|nr:DNA-processing protein DprA [Bacteroidaceae bacterium]
MTEQETLNAISLSFVPRMNLLNRKMLFEKMGSASEIFEQRRNLKEIIPNANKSTLEALAMMDIHLKRAEEELRFAQNGHIQCIGYNDEAYPARLRECPDAPILLYYRGTASLNSQHIISMVGTRQITPYGKGICREFIKDLKRLCPDALVVSGLAYGVDVHCHRAALEQDMETVGVLAHGLDQIYPRMHRDTAVQMVQHGGLLTEFPSRSNADKKNFVQRNRIVAGVADATIVVESAKKGGSLITAEIAESYGRDVFAFPGRIGDTYSQGCNNLIKNNRAGLIANAEDFIQAMGWETEVQTHKQLSQGLQQELFPELSEEEQRIVKALTGTDSKQINILTIDTAIPIGKLTSLLFNLEMKGVVRLLSGGCYRLA